MKEKRELTEAEERRLRARAARDPWLGAMLLLVWRAGLTVAEAAVLRWEDVDLSAPSVTAGGRTVPLEPETAAVLGRLGKGRKWVFPSRRNEGEPVSRMTVNRELRLLLDEEGLEEFQPRDLKNLHILRVLEEATLEEAVRVTGVEAVTLRDTWKEYGRTEPPRATPAGSARPDGQALERALLREGDTLDGRIIRLSWQGGLYLREIRALRWADVSAYCKYWYVGAERKKRPIPEGLRPWLRAWRERGGVYVVEGPRSGRPPDETALSHRAAIFFARHGLEGISVSSLRGNGQVSGRDRERLLEEVGRRGYCGMALAQRRLEMTPNQVRSAAEALRREGRLDPEGGELLCLPGFRFPRERFRAALEESAGETLDTAELRKRCGIQDGSLYNYIHDALREGRLIKTGYGRYRVPDKSR